jgi:hypothetical protein
MSDAFSYFGNDDTALIQWVRFVKPDVQIGIEGADLMQVVEGELRSILDPGESLSCGACILLVGGNSLGSGLDL